MYTNHDKYDLGDRLVANCTAPPAVPPAQLSFQINNRTVSSPSPTRPNGVTAGAVLVPIGPAQAALTHKRQDAPGAIAHRPKWPPCGRGHPVDDRRRGAAARPAACHVPADPAPGQASVRLVISHSLPGPRLASRLPATRWRSPTWARPARPSARPPRNSCWRSPHAARPAPMCLPDVDLARRPCPLRWRSDPWPDASAALLARAASRVEQSPPRTRVPPAGNKEKKSCLFLSLFSLLFFWKYYTFIFGKKKFRFKL